MTPEEKKDILKQIFQKTRVVTETELEAADCLACSPISYNPDDVQGNCSLCHAVVYWSFDAPKNIKRICVECLLIETKGILPDGSCLMSSKTQAEAILKFLEDLTKK